VGHLGVIRHILRELNTEAQTGIMRFVDKKDYTGLDNYLAEINAPADMRERLHELINLGGDNSTAGARNIVGDLPELDVFDRLLTLLDAYGVDYSVDFGIARGLDYYTGMVFEIYAEGLGAQKQVCGGGSYQLIKLFGGGDVPSTGFGIGFDRIMEICKLVPEKVPEVVVIATDDTRPEAAAIAKQLRKTVPVYLDIMERSFRNQLAYANSIGANYVVIVGRKELEAGKITLRDMGTGEQAMTTVEEALGTITKRA
jgi:histidyl-tRNA synthetase